MGWWDNECWGRWKLDKRSIRNKNGLDEKICKGSQLVSNPYERAV